MNPARIHGDILDLGRQRSKILEPFIGMSSLICWEPISASPRATTAPTGSPDFTFAVFALTSSAMPIFWNMLTM